HRDAALRARAVRGERLREAHAAGGERVEVRGTRDGTAERADRVRALLVRHEQQEVGSAGAGHTVRLSRDRTARRRVEDLRAREVEDDAQLGQPQHAVLLARRTEADAGGEVAHRAVDDLRDDEVRAEVRLARARRAQVHVGPVVAQRVRAVAAVLDLPRDDVVATAYVGRDELLERGLPGVAPAREVRVRG